MTNIAIIPARGGSKRIPRKNIKLFGGKPMIAWSIEAALNSDIFDRVIVSTDDIEIAQVARNYGAETPFLRPDKISDDLAGSDDVMVHALNYFSEMGINVRHACCIYATAPFITPSDIRKTYVEIADSEWDFIFPISKFSSPILRSFGINDSGSVEMFFPQFYSMRSQDLPSAYFDAGQFYWGSTNAWMSRLQIFSNKSKGFEIPWWRAIDIDTEEDWLKAELMAYSMNHFHIKS